MTKAPKANKELGQHYLNSERVITAICEDVSSPIDAIIEVGPGPGVLTKNLASKNIPLYLIEKDTRFQEILESIVPSENIFFTDATQFDWQKFFEENALKGKNVWLVSNLPYNVGSVLYVQFLPLEPIKYMTLMFQKEVGQKTYLRDEKNQMNGLLFLGNIYFHAKHLIKVPPGCFSPPPKVDSVVVSFERKRERVQFEFEKLNQFSRLVFSGKRKQLKGVLKQKYSSEIIESSFAQAEIPSQIRAEALTFDQLVTLFRVLES